MGKVQTTQDSTPLVMKNTNKATVVSFCVYAYLCMFVIVFTTTKASWGMQTHGHIQ